ncbi:MAG: hypothetical protein Q9164_002547 [Protoblastenia rupestris]
MANGKEDWKSSGRPQSVVAQNFSASLHDVFGIDNSLGGLTQSVEQKKKAVDSQTKELEALEARLKETEERLKQKTSRTSSPSGVDSPNRRQPVGDTFNRQESEQVRPSVSSPLATQQPEEAQKTGPQQLSPSTLSRWGPPTQESRRQGPTSNRKPTG